ncbi:hypothetical protein BGW38_005376 [Lunasporangiospora selenospora]|uniref:Uncharacterized protein n=1 Tax=Lunasporangiospora selenospora TaxID=979761 RepID=A0A9P6FNY4_9FUNG|nr:hypothetical protein BGW38_005376 [Lunasporangiospora selenospora]
MSFPSESKAPVQFDSRGTYPYQGSNVVDPAQVGGYVTNGKPKAMGSSSSAPVGVPTPIPSPAQSVPVSYKDSISHPINVSWIIPPWVSALLQEDMSVPNQLYLIPFAQREADALKRADATEDMIARAMKLYPNWRPRGNLGLSSCPGKKVRLDGPVNGRAKIVRDLDLDFDRLQGLGVTCVVCCLFDDELELLGSPFPKYLEAANSHGIDVIRLRYFRDHREVIEWVRAQRSPKAIETKEQAHFVAGFQLWAQGGLGREASKGYELEIQKRIDWAESGMAQARNEARAMDVLVAANAYHTRAKPVPIATMP